MQGFFPSVCMFICVLNKNHTHPASWVNIVCSTGGLRWGILPVPGFSPSWFQGEVWNDTGWSSDPAGAGSFCLFIYFLEGHLNHHHHAAYSSPFFFFFICILPLQSHLGFFREINLWLSVTRENYFFSVCCLSTVKHFMSTCFYQQWWQKNEGRKKGDSKSPLSKCQRLLVEPTDWWPCRNCQGLTRIMES